MQSDLLIQNATWQGVRLDLQGALQAVNTKSSGAGDPAFTYPYMDAAKNGSTKLRVRNALDSGYIDYFDTAQADPLIKAVNARRLVASFFGNNSASQYQVTLPAGLTSVHYAIEASNLAQGDSTGVFLTVSTLNASGGGTGGLGYSATQIQSPTSFTLPVAPAAGVSKQNYLFSHVGAVDTLSSTGIITKTPNGRLTNQFETFQITGAGARSVEGACWSVPYTVNLNTLIVRAFLGDGSGVRALSNSFSMSFYV